MKETKKYYIVMESIHHGKTFKKYKKYKCIEGFSEKKELCWKFSKQGGLNIIERMKRQCPNHDTVFYLEESQ